MSNILLCLSVARNASMRQSFAYHVLPLLPLAPNAFPALVLPGGQRLCAPTVGYVWAGAPALVKHRKRTQELFRMVSVPPPSRMKLAQVGPHMAK